MKSLAIAAAALVASAGFAPTAVAQSAPAPKGERCQEPKGFSYKICNGRRVPKGTPVASADGSSREIFRDGKCVTVKERTAAGEYRETRRCDD